MTWLSSKSREVTEASAHSHGYSAVRLAVRARVPLELIYTAVPFVIISVLFYFTVVVQTKVEKIEDNPGVTVDVTAFQWNWRFAYREVTLDGNNIKLERENPYGKQPDIAKLNEEAEKMKEHGHVEAQPERVVTVSWGNQEAALALGATRWGMITAVVLPFGRGGIIGGTSCGCRSPRYPDSPGW